MCVPGEAMFAFNEFLFFCNVHSFMNNTNLSDRCQAHLAVQFASNSFARCATGVD